MEQGGVFEKELREDSQESWQTHSEEEGPLLQSPRKYRLTQGINSIQNWTGLL